VRRPRASITRADQIRAEDRVLIRVDRPARSEYGGPPVPHRVRGPGQRVEDDYEVVACLVQLAIEIIRLHDVAEGLSGLGGEALHPVESQRPLSHSRTSRIFRGGYAPHARGSAGPRCPNAVCRARKSPAWLPRPGA